ncbi:hypothetical protein MMC14_006665 [Varicellaria rhodocarpa]|nr:hypothetical protein [Varicellaria rhodocarpa]
MSSESPHPVSIHIPAELSHLIIPPQQFLQMNSEIDNLAVGAFIFSPSATTPSTTRLLLIQRAATERAFPHCWEVPGGGAEYTDPTVLHSVAREVFEETGLHLTKLVRRIGNGIKFETRKHVDRWLKLSFEIEVAELKGYYPAHSVLVNEADSEQEGEKQRIASEESAIHPSISICLDPTEHQDFRWVTEEEVRNSENRLQLVSDDQKGVILEAFRLHRIG